MVEMTNGEVMQAAKALEELGRERLPVPGALRVRKVTRAVQAHPYVKSYTAYAHGINYVAWGPWNVNEFGQTFYLQLRINQGAGQTWGYQDGGTHYLVFRRA